MLAVSTGGVLRGCPTSVEWLDVTPGGGNKGKMVFKRIFWKKLVLFRAGVMVNRAEENTGYYQVRVTLDSAKIAEAIFTIPVPRAILQSP